MNIIEPGIRNLVTAKDALLTPYGLGNFSAHYRQAVDAYFDAETAYRKGNYVQASKVLDAFWRRHPAGSREWALGYDEAVSVAQSTGANFGAPVCYYALRMLTDCVAWKTKPRPCRPTPGRRALPCSLWAARTASNRVPNSSCTPRPGSKSRMA